MRRNGFNTAKISEIAWKEDTDLGGKAKTGRALYS